MLDRLIKFGLIFLIIYCPLAFGAVHIFSFTLMEMTVLGLWLCWLLKQILSRSGQTGFVGRGGTCGKLALSIKKSPLNYFVVVFVGLVVGQLLPWPASWVKILSPSTFKIYKQAWGQVPGFISLSLYNYRLKLGLFKLLAYVGAFLLIINWADTREKIKPLVISFILVGSIEAVYGILAYVGKYPFIWWYKNRWYLSAATGTYINRNHLAGLLEITIPVTFGFLLTLAARRKRDQKESSSRMGGFRGFLLSLNVDDHYQAGQILLTFLMAIMTLALFLSGSRGGILSLTIAFTIMSILLLSRPRLRKYAITGLVIISLAASYGVFTGLNTTIERFGKMNRDSKARFRFAKTSLGMVRDFPLLGTGWGTFIEAYRKYQDPKDERLVIDHAHQDWIELGAETGLLGLGVAVFFLLFCLGYLFCLWKKRKNKFSVGLGLGGMGAIISLTLHSFTDFNMHIPANALLLSMVVGISWAALTCQQGSRKAGTQGPSRSGVKAESLSIYFPDWLRWPLAIFMVVGFCYAIALLRKPCLAERFVPTLPDSTIKIKKDPSLEDIGKAIACNTGNAEYFYRLALLLERESVQQAGESKGENQCSKVSAIFEKSGNDGLRRGSGKNDLILFALKRAVSLNPINPYYHLKLAWHRLDLGKEDENLDIAVLTRAEEEFARAVYFMPSSAYINFSVGCYWLWKSKVVQDESAYLDAFERSIKYFQAAYRLNHNYKNRIKHMVQQYYPVDDILVRIFVT